jgi:acetyltransferase (GNAT) family protein
MMGTKDIGHVVFQVCRQCRVGYIGKISVDELYQDRGIATRAVARLRSEAPGYRWSTTTQYSTVRTFWRRTSRRAGGGYDTASPCDHMSQARRATGT